MKKVVGFFASLVLAGCGAVQTAQVRDEMKRIQADFRSKDEECKLNKGAPELALLGQKVELFRENPESLVPVTIPANDNHPRDADQALILRSAAIGDQFLAAPQAY